MPGPPGHRRGRSRKPKHDPTDSADPDSMLDGAEQQVKSRRPGPTAVDPRHTDLPRAEFEPIEGGIVYDSEALMFVHHQINESYLGRLKLIETSASALAPKAGAFFDGFRVNDIVLGVRSTHLANRDSLDRIYQQFLDGLWTVIQRYDRSSDDQDGLVADLSRIIEKNGTVRMETYKPRTSAPRP